MPATKTKAKPVGYLDYKTIKSWGPCFDPARGSKKYCENCDSDMDCCECEDQEDFGSALCKKTWKGTIFDILDHESISQEDKIWCGIQYLDEKQQRLFAVWCAREALKLVDNPDPRSVNACDVAERFAHGNATQDELIAARTAARTAAWTAAEDAARTAARYAARTAARYAAEDAARYAARAARTAARTAAETAQIERIKEFIRLIEHVEVK